MNSLGNDGAKVLAQALESNSALWCLRLGYNRISRPTDLFSCLGPDQQLIDLELCGNPIFDEQESCFVAENRECLSQLVVGSRGLKYICLGMTCLGDEECLILREALSVTSGSLAFISLGRNRVTSQGAAALAEGLERNATLRFLNLAVNAIADDGAVALAQCVQARNRTSVRLRRVFMGGNRCDASCFVAPMVDTVFSYSDTVSTMEALDL